MATVVKSFAIQGIDGYPVDIEIKTLEGQPMISIIGLGDLSVKEAAERIQATAVELALAERKVKKLIITSGKLCYPNNRGNSGFTESRAENGGNTRNPWIIQSLHQCLPAIFQNSLQRIRSISQC